MDERVQITIGNKGRSDCKIVIDGLDISSLTQSFTIKANTDSVPTLELTLIPGVMKITGNPDIVKNIIQFKTSESDVDTLVKRIIKGLNDTTIRL